MSIKLSGTVFILSQITILIVGLAFIGWLYFFLQEPSKIPSNSSPITTEPASLTLEVNSPEDDLLSFKDEILVSGKTQAGSTVLISTDDNDQIVKTSSTGAFSADFPLELGVNNITIAVFDESGDSRTVEKMVYYSKEKI